MHKGSSHQHKCECCSSVVKADRFEEQEKGRTKNTSLRYIRLNTERFRKFTVDTYLLIPSAEETFEPFEGVAVQAINLKFL